MPTKRIEDLYNQRFQNYGTQGQGGPDGDANGRAWPRRRCSINFMDNHDVPRFLFDFNDLDALHNGLFYLLTMDGIPCIYYGTEQAFNGGNDPANREDMFQLPLNDYYVLYDEQGEPIPRDERAERFEPFNRAHPTYQHIKKLNELRAELAPLRRGDFVVRWSSERTGQEQDAGILAFERNYDGETVLVVVNTHPGKSSTTSATDLGGGNMTVGFDAGTTLVDRWDEDYTVTVGGDGTVAVEAPPRSGRILVRQ